MTFKIGDKVKIMNRSHEPLHCYKIGSVVEVTGVTSNGDLMLKGNPKTDGASNQTVNPKCVGIDGIFEDEWHLNNGKVTIPDDAHKLMDGGSVVAFRKRKPVVFKFGDRIKAGLNEYIFVKYEGCSKDKCIVAHESGVFEDQRVSLFTKV